MFFHLQDKYCDAVGGFAWLIWWLAMNLIVHLYCSFFISEVKAYENRVPSLISLICFACLCENSLSVVRKGAWRTEKVLCTVLLLPMIAILGKLQPIRLSICHSIWEFTSLLSCLSYLNLYYSPLLDCLWQDTHHEVTSKAATRCLCA